MMCSMMYRNQIFGLYEGCVTTMSVKFMMFQTPAVNFTSGVVSDKVAFSARDCFCSVLSIAIKIWRARVEHACIGLDDDTKLLLDLRFADDLLLLGNTAANAALQLDEICAALGTVGLILNSAKTKVRTSRKGGLVVQIFRRDEAHKWLGCKMSKRQSNFAEDDFHCRSACKAFCANTRIFCDRTVFLQHRLHFLHAALSLVACYTAGHRNIPKQDLHNVDVTCRRLHRSVVGCLRHRKSPQPKHARSPESPRH